MMKHGSTTLSYHDCKIPDLFRAKFDHFTDKQLGDLANDIERLVMEETQGEKRRERRVMHACSGCL